MSVQPWSVEAKLMKAEVTASRSPLISVSYHAAGSVTPGMTPIIFMSGQ